MKTLQLGATATIVFNCRIALTGATVSITLSPPAGANKVFSGSIVAGNSMQASYKTTIADLDETGEWSAQAAATFPNGDVLPSRIAMFNVEANL